MQYLLNGTIIDWLMGIVNLIPKFMYFICVSLMSVVDVFQLLVRKLAGLDTYYVDGVAQAGDIVLSFIKSLFTENSNFPALKNVFWSLVIFGFLLLIVATIIAIIRQEYMPSSEDAKDKPSNNKLNIIKKSVKSVFLFLIVPVSCIFGLMLSDLLLYTLDSITTSASGSSSLTTNVNSNLLEYAQLPNGKLSCVNYDMFGFHAPATTTTFSGAMFRTAAYDANRVRIDDEIFQGLHNGTVDSFNLFNQSDNKEECAQMIDDAFANCVKLKNPTGIKVDGTLLDGTANVMIFAIREGKQVSHFSKFNVGLVFYYYNLWYFNFLIGFAFLVISLKLFVSIIFGLMKRIIELVALLLVSPPIVAIMPLDNGKAFTNWRQNFISKALGAFGAIVGMNVLFLILPYLNQIQFFDPINKGLNILNLILSCLFIIVGLSMVEGFIKLMSGLIGGEDIAKAGSDIASKVGDTLASSAKLTGAAAGLAVKPVTLAGKLGLAGTKLAGKGIGSVINKIGAKRTGKKDYDFVKDGKLVPAFVNLGNKIASGAKKVASLPGKIFTGKARKKASNEFAEQWEKEGATNAYQQYYSENKNFTQELYNRYQKRNARYKDMSLDEWKATKEGQTSVNDILTSASDYGFQTFEDYTKGVQIQRDANGNIENVDVNDNTEIGRIFKEQRDKKVKEAAKSVNQRIVAGFIKHTNIAGISASVSSVASIYFDNIKSSMVSGGKGGIKSMISAFQGKTASQIEQDEMIKKVQKEETAKVKAQQKAKEDSLKNETEKLQTDSNQQEQEFLKLKQETEKIKRDHTREINELKSQIKKIKKDD